jgi:AAA+ ATPase superfamily predicted ATPase
VLSQGAPLAAEPENLLQAEFREVERYATILRAIGDGSTTSGDIIGRIRESKDASAFLPYAQKLAEMRLIRISHSLDASPRERDRRYYIDDPFLSFWYFSICMPHISTTSRLFYDPDNIKSITCFSDTDRLKARTEWVSAWAL